jgi:hypothetical protein
MSDPNQGINIPSVSGSYYGDIVLVLTSFSGVIWKLWKMFVARYSKKGMYEVIDFQTRLIIHDPKGKSASLTKYEKVRFLQDNNLAFQDQAWSDGKFLLNYHCSPGIPVDVYRTGYKTFVLISLHELKNKGDVTEFNISWDLKNTFLKKVGFWSTDISHSTNHIKVQVIFPKLRPPKKVVLVESNQRKEKSLEEKILPLPDKRYQITWEKNNPRLYEQYILKWIW